MKTKDKVQLAKQLLPIMPEFTIKGSMMFMQPMEHVLRGVFFENSAFDKSIYVWIFLIPLFVPTEHVYFNFGYRMPRPNHKPWQTDSDNFLNDLEQVLIKNLPFLYGVRSLENFIKTLGVKNSPQNLHIQEAIAYTLALNGDTAESISALSNLIPQFDTQSPWQLEMQERAGTLKATLEEDPSKAIKLLESWEAETIKNLGLEKFAST